MPNTLTKSNRTSLMTLSPDRALMLNTPGSMYKLHNIIAENKINISAQEIINSMPTYLQYMTENQKLVFRAHYWRQMSIYDIRIQYNFRTISEVERPLKSATEKYIRLIKADYGTKE